MSILNHTNPLVKMIQGFRKVDPDRWEFANEGFLGGQKHLLKNIKRRRNVSQSSQQQQQQQHERGACVELGQFGLETEADRLRRDCSVLMAEVMKLKQQQQNSEAQLFAMEERIQGTERKQQQTMAFLGRSLKNPMFVQQLILRMDQNKQLGSLSKKRRLPANLSSDYPQATEVAEIELEVESLFSTMNDDSSSSNNIFQKDEVVSESGDRKLETACEVMWNELLDEDMLTGTEVEQGGGQAEIEAGMEGLGTKHWGEDVESLVEHMVFLDSKPYRDGREEKVV